MKRKPMLAKKGKSSRGTLRIRAEKVHPNRKRPSMPEADVQKLTHELQIHQIELEMQNQELRSKQMELEQARNQYVDLYDFAPFGYFVFDTRGKILGLNLAGASLLGRPRSRLVGRLFTLFLEEGFLHPFLRHLRGVPSSNQVQTAEFKIRKEDTKSSAYVLFYSAAVTGEGIKIRSAVTDITDRKSAEEELSRTRQELIKSNEYLRYLSNRLLTVHEEERRRIALDVHDGFAASLSAINYQLQGLPPEFREKHHLEGISKQLELAISEARRIQTYLRPPLLDDLGIGPALNWLSREFQKTYPLIRIETDVQIGKDSLSDPLTTAIYRITQEALNNTVKHSKANLVMLSLTKKDGVIDLVIQDDGQGFDADTVPSGDALYQGLGLSSMKERAALSGGVFRIQSGHGKGVTIRVSWKLKESTS